MADLGDRTGICSIRRLLPDIHFDHSDHTQVISTTRHRRSARRHSSRGIYESKFAADHKEVTQGSRCLLPVSDQNRCSQSPPLTNHSGPHPSGTIWNSKRSRERWMRMFLFHTADQNRGPYHRSPPTGEKVEDIIPDDEPQSSGRQLIINIPSSPLKTKVLRNTSIQEGNLKPNSLLEHQ